MEAVQFPALPARVANTSGAGDCLVAGALWGLTQGLDPAAALAHGMVRCLPESCLARSAGRLTCMCALRVVGAQLRTLQV